MKKNNFDDWRRNVGYLHASLCAFERTLADQLAQIRMITFMGRQNTGFALEKREDIICHLRKAIYELVNIEKEVLQAESDAIIKHDSRKEKKQS